MKYINRSCFTIKWLYFFLFCSKIHTALSHYKVLSCMVVDLVFSVAVLENLGPFHIAIDTDWLAMVDFFVSNG